jgi:hypothetical protein
MTDMVIMPREATEEMGSAGRSAVMRTHRTPSHEADAVYTAMLAAAPASGKVTEEQVEKMAKAIYVAHEIMEGFTEEQALFALKNAQVLRNMLRDYTPISRAALASIGLEAE